MVHDYQNRLSPNFNNTSHRLADIYGKLSDVGTRVHIFGIWRFEKLWIDFVNFHTVGGGAKNICPEHILFFIALVA